MRTVSYPSNEGIPKNPVRHKIKLAATTFRAYTAGPRMPLILDIPDASPYLRATRIRVRHDVTKKMRKKNSSWKLNVNVEWWNGDERYGGVLHRCELAQEHSSKNKIASTGHGKKGGEKPEALIIRLQYLT